MTPAEELMTLPSRIRSIYSECSTEEQDYLRRILEELSQTGTSKLYDDLWLADYKEIPVDIDTFLVSDTYLGKTNRNGESIYPFWRQTLHDIFTAGNKYNEIAFTGATRIGKTSTAITGVAYMLYRLMCLRNPQEYYNKKEVSQFSILFFNITRELARSVAFREFNDTLKGSPWFNAHGHFTRSEENSYYIPEGGKISIDYGSSGAHGLGKQVFCAIMDEMAFSQAGIHDIQKAKQRMKNTYNTVSARIRGTFRQDGEIHGKLFAVSSKNSDNDFMEDYIRTTMDAGGEHMYVVDKPQWEILPPSMFHKETFYIAVGDRHLKGFVVPDNQTDPESLDDLQKQGFKLMTPPIDMKHEFTADFDIALRDLAGISVPGVLSFITQEVITSCINKNRRNPFFNDIIEIGVKDRLTIQEFFHSEVVDERMKRQPLFIHLDLSLTGDKTGISGVWRCGHKDVPLDDERSMSMPTFVHMFTVSLLAPRGDKIPFSKIIAFIKWLRKSGYNIQAVTRDQYQSEYLGELLEEAGFESPKLSLDRTPDGYMALRSVLIEERIDMLDVQLLQDELVHLQRDTFSGKVDHPIDGCFTPDTKIQLVDGRQLSIAELMLEQIYRDNYVYTVNELTLNREVNLIQSVHPTKIASELVKIVLDTPHEDIIKCTPEHRFMIPGGRYCEAQALKAGSCLLTYYGTVKVLKISRMDKQQRIVFDLTIQNNPNFALACGPVVHNSKDSSDSFAGAVWKAIQTAPELRPSAKSTVSTIKSLNQPRGTTGTQKLPSVFGLAQLNNKNRKR